MFLVINEVVIHWSAGLLCYFLVWSSTT